MKRILVSLVTITAAAAITIGLSGAFFYDSETSTGNTFQAGAIDLKIDNKSYYRGELSDLTTWTLDDLTGHLFFNFTDVKPGDWGEDTISIHVNTNDAWACSNMTLTSDDDNSCTSSELINDSSCVEDNQDTFDGELGGLLNIIFWVDDGDNVLETNESTFYEGSVKDFLNGTSWTLADSINSIFDNLVLNPQGALIGQDDYYIAKAWCFGNLSKTPVTEGQGIDPTVSSSITCDGSGLNNASQTDSVIGDIEFYAEQARSNSEFMCELPECVVQYPVSTQDNNQGKNKNGTPVLANRSNTSSIFAIESTGTPYDNPVIAGSFFSLGFKVSQPQGGSIVAVFSNPVFNYPGNDLYIAEITGGTSYPDEKIKVEASKDGVSWITLTLSLTRDGNVDLGALDWAKYVRVTDVSDISLFEATADGYDLDGIRSICNSI